MKEITSESIESRDDRGNLALTDKSVTHRVRMDAEDVRYLEMALKALREIRELFGIGAEAESKLKAASPKASVHLAALLRTGAVRVTTQWKGDGR